MSSFVNWIANSKLAKDTGVTAFIAIETVTFVFVLLTIALLKGTLAMDILLPILSGWMGIVLGAYFTLKSAKQAGGK